MISGPPTWSLDAGCARKDDDLDRASEVLAQPPDAAEVGHVALLADQMLPELTAEVFKASQAKEIGLVHELVPAKELLSRSRSVIDDIARNCPNAVRAAKELVLSFERWTPEGQEGLSAFLEKRPPSWAKP